MHPVGKFIRNPIKVAVGVLLLALFGAISLVRMPMQLTPEVEIPTITIETRWPGASPQEVELEIIQEQEEQLQGVEGVTKMSSESQDSRGLISLKFLVGTDMSEALLKVNSRLAQVPEYPENADEPVISTSSSSDRPIAWFILSARLPPSEKIEAFQDQLRRLDPQSQLARKLDGVLGSTNPGLAELRLRRLVQSYPEVEAVLPPRIEIPKLRKFAEDVIEAQLERVPGVSNSNVLGGREMEFQVVLDPHKLAARQLTMQDVRQVLRSQNKDTSGGDFWEGKRRYVVRTLGQFRSPEQVMTQVLAVHDGAPVYLRDVVVPGGVRLGYKKPDGFVRRFSSASLAINAQRETGANVLDVMRGLRRQTERLNQTILKDRNLVLTQVYDETDYIYSAIGLVNQNIVVGGLLTILVLLLFLRSGRSTLVIGLAIPTSIVGTFLMLHLMGRSLNVISLAGLAFAVGMLVDNAVVVLENIYRYSQRGERPFEAAENATKEVWGAVFASTLTTLAVFLPVLFVQEEAGQLFRDIALAISSAVGLSLLISITLIPTSAARLFRQSDPESSPTPVGNQQEKAAPSSARSSRLAQFLSALDAGAARFVRHVIQINFWIQLDLKRRLMVAGVFVGVATLLTLLFWPKMEYLPSGNRNLVIGVMMPPPGYHADRVMEMGATMEEALRPYWDVDPESDEALQLDYPAIGDFFYVARRRQAFLGLRAADPTRAAELIPLVRGLKDQLPGTIIVANQTSLFQRGLTAGRNIDIEVTGPELLPLVELGKEILQQVGQVVPNSQARPIPSLDMSSPEVHVSPKLIQSRDMGVSATDLGYIVDTLVDGAYAADYFIGGQRIDLTISGNPNFQGRTQDLQGLYVATPLVREPVRLDSLAEIEISYGPEQINHRERLRAITIQVIPPPEIPLEEAIDLINAQILGPLREGGRLGEEYLVSLSGAADKLRDTWQAMRWNLLFALLITFLLMAALFESWLYPLVIILSVPLGAVGGVLGLRLLGVYLWLQGLPAQALDVLTMLGFVILVGTVVNNAILIVHQSLNHMRLEGLDSRKSILEAIRIRIRPIFMTTTTTVFGLAPLVLFPGAGSELYRGLGSVVLGGLLVSTVFTLVLVPTLFSLMLEARQWVANRVAGPVVLVQEGNKRGKLVTGLKKTGEGDERSGYPAS